MGEVISLSSVRALAKLRAEQNKSNLVVAELSPEGQSLRLAKLILEMRVLLGLDSPAPAEKHKPGVVAVHFRRKDKSPHHLASRNEKERRPRAKAKPRLQEKPA
jgi:hypothetical protein